jgi:hypothetical protein
VLCVHLVRRAINAGSAETIRVKMKQSSVTTSIEPTNLMDMVFLRADTGNSSPDRVFYHIKMVSRSSP